jgi:hypothetical protein
MTIRLALLFVLQGRQEEHRQVGIVFDRALHVVVMVGFLRVHARMPSRTAASCLVSPILSASVRRVHHDHATHVQPLLRSFVAEKAGLVHKEVGVAGMVEVLEMEEGMGRLMDRNVVTLAVTVSFPSC